VTCCGTRPVYYMTHLIRLGIIYCASYLNKHFKSSRTWILASSKEVVFAKSPGQDSLFNGDFIRRSERPLEGCLEQYTFSPLCYFIFAGVIVCVPNYRLPLARPRNGLYQPCIHNVVYAKPWYEQATITDESSKAYLRPLQELLKKWPVSCTDHIDHDINPARLSWNEAFAP
jgi:hypothetical protein